MTEENDNFIETIPMNKEFERELFGEVPAESEQKFVDLEKLVAEHRKIKREEAKIKWREEKRKELKPAKE